MARAAPRFHDFIGQKPTVDFIRRALAGAQARGEPFPHSLVYGPSGTGKTLLAKAIAAEMGTNPIAAMGYDDGSVLGEKLGRLCRHDILFVDEAHRLGHAEQEMLVETIDANSIPGPAADGRLRRYALELTSWGDGSGVPTSGKDLVIVGLDSGGLLRIRTFDDGGKRVTDADETKLPDTQAGAISALKRRLPGLLPPHGLTVAETTQLRGDLTSIFGRIIIPPSTVVLATDQPGRLLDALDKRMSLNVSLAYYLVTELREIVEAMAADPAINVLLTPQAARLVAEVSGGLPRRALLHLRGIRLFHPDAEGRKLTESDVRGYLDATGFDKEGVGPTERRYLEVLARQGPSSLESITLEVGVDLRYGRRQIEPALVRRGLVEITPAGRRLTAKGREWAERRQPADSGHRRDGGP